jgi:hypothetical protein
VLRLRSLRIAGFSSTCHLNGSMSALACFRQLSGWRGVGT